MKSEPNLKIRVFLYLLLFLIVFMGAFTALGHCQVSVTPNCSLGKCQLFDRNGKPLAGGKVFTYDSGTTTLRSTYSDAGGVAQNTDPISLDAGGYASIWLANQAYKFCVYNSALVLQYPCIDNVTGYLGLLNFANTWTFPQTFLLPITDLAVANQFVLGGIGNQTTLDFQVPIANITLHFPNTADTMVGRATTDNLNNKNLIAPTFNSTGCAIINGPGAYICIANANPTGTTVSTLTKIANAPSQATILPHTDVGGALGICVAGCGNTGTATIQQTGTANCVFDGATTAGDAVAQSSTVDGQCHDAGAVSTGQMIGRVTSTNGGGGTYSVDLFGPSALSVYVASGTQNLGNATITAGNCTSLNSTATGAVSGQAVAWAYENDGSITASDLKLTVSALVAPNIVSWQICNGTAGNLTQSNHAITAWRVLP